MALCRQVRDSGRGKVVIKSQNKQIRKNKYKYHCSCLYFIFACSDLINFHISLKVALARQVRGGGRGEVVCECRVWRRGVICISVRRVSGSVIRGPAAYGSLACSPSRDGSQRNTCNAVGLRLSGPRGTVTTTTPTRMLSLSVSITRLTRGNGYAGMNITTKYKK